MTCGFLEQQLGCNACSPGCCEPSKRAALVAAGTATRSLVAAASGTASAAPATVTAAAAHAALRCGRGRFSC